MLKFVLYLLFCSYIQIQKLSYFQVIDEMEEEVEADDRAGANDENEDIVENSMVNAVQWV